MNKKAFTLIEIMIWILIFSIVIIGGFKAYGWVLVWKIKLIESTNIQKEAFYFSEKFFEEIKVGWVVDYEEYFNRETVWTTILNGHYSLSTWFWNYWTNWTPWNTTYWDWFYYCRSTNWVLMGTWWCVNDFNTDWSAVNNKPQRYWQYSFHFIDYNSNFNEDTGFSLWDEDWNWNITWDDDDEYLWIWPDAFSWATDQKEIYLISADSKKRTIFRWHIKDDTNDNINTCDLDNWWIWCNSTIEFLKLEWKDWWFNHEQTWNGLYDWIVDTWVIDKDFSWETNIDEDNAIIAWWSSDTWFWQPLFWDNINVSDVKFYIFPHKDLNLSWKDFDKKINISPYLKMKITLSPSYEARKWFKWKIPKIKINTTINLTDIYSI